MSRKTLGRLAGIASLGFLAAQVSAESLPDAMARYESLALAGRAIEVSGVPVRVGHMEATLREGTLTPVLAGTETVGFYFVGKGDWRYESACSDEFAVVRRDAGEVTRWKVEDDSGRPAIRDEFDEILWIEPGGSTWPSKGQDRAVPQGQFQKHRDYFARRKFDSAAQRLAYRKLSGSPAALVWAEIAGGRNSALYLYDGTESLQETLAVVKKRESDSANAPEELLALPISSQPIDRGCRERARPPALLTDVRASIEADGEHAKLDVVETYRAGSRPLALLRLNLRSRVFAGSALDVRPQTLSSVETADGRAVPFDHRNGAVLLALPGAVPPGREITLRFRMDGDMLYRPNNDAFWMLGFDAWYPQPDFGASDFTWKCSVRVRAPFVPIVSGSQAERASADGWNSVTAEIDRPVFLPVVLAGNYDIDEEKIDGRTFRIASYVYHNRRATEHLAKLASQIIAFYEPFLGPFPWKELTIVEINALGFGVAPPATMFITREAFSPHEDDFTKLLSQGLNERFAHEIAHQYWGHQVKWGDDADEWLSESFAEYCAYLAVRRIKGESYARKMVARWRAGAHDADAHATIPTADRLLGESAFRDRFGLLYGKGPYLLRAIDRDLGEQMFLTALKTFQSNLRWKTGSTRLFRNLLEFLTKRSWSDFFDRYFWGTEIPNAD
jgi:hypothetical protein